MKLGIFPSFLCLRKTTNHYNLTEVKPFKNSKHLIQIQRGHKPIIYPHPSNVTSKYYYSAIASNGTDIYEPSYNN